MIDQPLPAEREAGIPKEDLEDLAQAAVAEELDRAIALRQEGQNLFLAQSRPGDALPLYDEAPEIFRRLGDRGRERTTLHDKGLVQGALGQPQEALASLKQALAVGREIQEAAGEGTIVNNIAAVYHGMGQLEEAIRYYKEALDIHRRLGDRANEQVALNNLAEALEALGRSEDATRCRREAASTESEGPSESPADETD
jgi:tetratricopeptide (TPR) repeat protein